MKKTMKNMLAVLSVLAVAGSASASIWSGAVDDDWDTVGNWDAAPVPGSAVTIDTVGAVVNKYAGNDATGLGTMAVDNGDLNIYGAIAGGSQTIGNGVGDVGTITVMSGDGSFGGWNSLATWDFTLADGGGNGTLVNNGGTIHAYGNWFNVAAWGGTALVQLNAGHLIVEGSELHVGAGGVIDLAGGTFAIAGSRLGDLAGLIDSGGLTSYGNNYAGNYAAGFAWDEVTNPGYTTITAIPEPATLSMVALLGGGMLWIRKRFKS